MRQKPMTLTATRNSLLRYFIFLLLLLWGWAGYWGWSSQQSQLASMHMESDCHQHANVYGTVMRQYEDVLQERMLLLNHEEAFTEAWRNGDWMSIAALLEGWLEVWKQTPVPMQVILTDEQGHDRWSSIDGIVIGETQRRPILNQAMRTSGQVSGFYLGDKQELVYLFSERRSLAGETLGYLIFEIAPEAFINQLSLISRSNILVMTQAEEGTLKVNRSLSGGSEMTDKEQQVFLKKVKDGQTSGNGSSRQRFNTVPMHDYQGKSVGKLLFAWQRNDPLEISGTKYVASVAWLISGVLGIWLWLFLWELKKRLKYQTVMEPKVSSRHKYEKSAELSEEEEHELKQWRSRCEKLRKQYHDVLERCLTAEQDRLRLMAAFDQAGDAITIVNRDGIVEYVNPALEQLTGVPAEQAIGEELFTLYKDEQNFKVYEDLWAQVRKTGKVWSGRLSTVRNDGKAIEKLSTVSIVRDDLGAMTHVVFVERDITRLQRLEMQLRQSQKLEAIGTLAGGVAHDFNNILQAMVGHAQVGYQKLAKDHPARNNLKKVLDGGMRARDLVRQILTFSRRSPREHRSTQLQPVVKEVLKLLQGTLPATIEIEDRVRSECSPVMCDPTQVHQIIMNLCTNAYHAMRDSGGKLEVALVEIEVNEAIIANNPDLKAGRYVLLTVADSGCGMTEETVARIFEPYFTTKTPEEGTGLGLSTVHGIVLDHSGAIQVQSKPGEGTKVHVYLPVALAHSEPTLPSEDEPMPRGQGRILLLDDENVIVHFASAVLTDLGYEVEAYTESVQAWEAFESNPSRYDLVITDQTMPRMTGDQLIRKALALRPDLKIILCTGYSEKIDEFKALDLGVKAFMMKPFRSQQLAQAVREVLAGYSQRA